jgi:hypothetical protein
MPTKETEAEAEYERMKQAIAVGRANGLSPLRSVANMSPKLNNAGALMRRWLDEQSEATHA